MHLPKLAEVIHKMKPLLFLHHLWLWKDSDNLLGEVLGGGGWGAYHVLV